MALILYPIENHNTFADVSIATTVINDYFPEKAVEWNSSSDATKEASLLQSYMYMMTCKGLKIPEDYTSVSSDFILAQCYLVTSRLGSSIFDIDANERAIIEESVGSVTVKYDSRYKSHSHEAPALYYQLMAKYGCSGGSGFSQSKVK